ncbi:MAG: hypothetical protein AAF327_14240 [Cyanobacteria bacterium P01_A01_bin.37]
MNTTAKLLHPSDAAAPYCTIPAQATPIASRPCLDWQKLVALGVEEGEAKTICEGLQIRRLMQSYCHLLAHAGVPSSDVKSVAWAIAKFDITGLTPSRKQQAKLHQYALPICRSNLWRTRLL